MDLTIYTYGHIDAMFYVLNGIAMIMNSTFTDMLIKTAAIVSIAYYGIKAAYLSNNGNSKSHLIKVFGMVIVINALLVPRTSMMVMDHVTKQRDEVDNLPYGFAIPVGLLEGFGDALTGGFEQAFTAVGNSNYRDYGMVFGARLVQEARNWRIKTPEFATNMDGFIRRCVVVDASMGFKYTANDLLTSEDIWALVSTKASPLRRIEIRQGNSFELVTCKEAAQILTKSFTSEIDVLTSKYQRSEFGLASILRDMFVPRGTIPAQSFFKKNIEAVFGDYIGNHTSSESQLRQYMMINSLSDYGSTYGFGRASMAQESNWRIAGDLASTYLPILLSVMKGLVYASFIFMVPLMLLSGGMGKYLSYITVVASLQLWPALNSILNMFIDLYSASQMQDLTGGIISFASYSRVGAYADKIAAVASGLQMTVPFLAFSLVQGGVSGFIHLAGNITGASQSAATAASQEVVTGNRSFDNYSVGNVQMAMNSGFKTDWNSSYRAGASELQQADGTMTRTMGDGSTIFQSGTGINMSGGSVRFNLREAQTAQRTQDLSNAQSLLESTSASFHDAERSTFSQTANYVSQLAQRENIGERFDYSKSGEEGKALQQAVSNAKTLRENYGYSWDQAASTALKGGFNIGIGKGSGGILSGGISGGVESSVSANNTSNQNFGDDKELRQDGTVRVDYNNVVKAASSEEFAKSNNIDKSYSDDIRQSYEKQQSLERQMVASEENVDRYSKALAEIQSRDASQDKDMYHDVEKRLADTYRVSPKEAHDMIERHDPRVGRIWNDMVRGNVTSLVGSEMRASQIKFTPQNRFKALDEVESKYQPKINKDYSSEIKEYSVKEGVNPNDKGFVQNAIEPKVNTMMNLNEEQINKVNQENQIVEMQRQSQINKYEEDRMGQGKFAQSIGSVPEALGFGNVGGPKNPSTINPKNGKSEVIEIATQIPTNSKGNK